MTFLRRAVTWLRLSVSLSNSAETWRERLGDAVLITGFVAAIALTIALPMEWWQVAVLWVACLMPAVVLYFAGWLKFFGPVLYYDMIRQARRTRFAALRFLFLVLLALLLWLVASVAYPSVPFRMLNARHGAGITQDYFDVFMAAQFVMVALLTPAYVGGAIAEEKDRKTLEFILATDLLNREIVFSKLGSRLANLVLVVLTGLPILSILQFLGGLDPGLVLAGFAITAMTIVGLASLSIYCSVRCKRPREAITASYLIVIMYFAVALMLSLVMRSGAAFTFWPSVVEAYSFYQSGNLFALIIELKSGGTPGLVLPGLVRGYALFHGVVFMILTGLAVLRVRRVALAQSYGKPKKVRLRRRIWRRPRVGTNPIMWKEIHCESGHRSLWIGLVIGVILFAATFVPAGLMIWEHLVMSRGGWSSYWQQINAWARLATSAAGCLTILAVGIRASTSISSERDKQTLDILLTTPMTTSSILWAKWLSSVCSVRLGIIWLGLIWVTALFSGGMHLIALPLVITAWLVYASFSATLGLWYSTVCRSSMRATVYTVLSLIALGGGHMLVGMMIISGIAAAFPGRSEDGETFVAGYMGLFSPAVVMGFLPIPYREFHEATWSNDRFWLKLAMFSLLGLALWSYMTYILYLLTDIRFARMARRTKKGSGLRGQGSVKRRKIAVKVLEQAADADLPMAIPIPVAIPGPRSLLTDPSP